MEANRKLMGEEHGGAAGRRHRRVDWRTRQPRGKRVAAGTVTEEPRGPVHAPELSTHREIVKIGRFVSPHTRADW